MALDMRVVPFGSTPATGPADAPQTAGNTAKAGVRSVRICEVCSGVYHNSDAARCAACGGKTTQFVAGKTTGERLVENAEAKVQQTYAKAKAGVAGAIDSTIAAGEYTAEQLRNLKDGAAELAEGTAELVSGGAKVAANAALDAADKTPGLVESFVKKVGPVAAIGAVTMASLPAGLIVGTVYGAKQVYNKLESELEAAKAAEAACKGKLCIITRRPAGATPSRPSARAVRTRRRRRLRRNTSSRPAGPVRRRPRRFPPAC